MRLKSHYFIEIVYFLIDFSFYILIIRFFQISPLIMRLTSLLLGMAFAFLIFRLMLILRLPYTPKFSKKCSTFDI